MESQLKRAGSYVRVSTYQESQEKSITDQVRMLNEIIDKDETLVNVGTYIDQGVTGKYQTKRKQFLALMKDCMEGKIDVVYCKQMSRFGRNALETMQAIEKLRSIGVAVRFVLDDIDTIVDKDCSRLAMLASIAEDERDNLQDTMTWSFHRRLEHFSPRYALRLRLGRKQKYGRYSRGSGGGAVHFRRVRKRHDGKKDLRLVE